MDDILFSMAWHCGDKDCPVGWHKRSFWIYCRGKRTTYSVDDFGDGDHESCTKRDLPTDAEVEQSWLDYSRDVAQTGEDPLGEFMVKYWRKAKERWECRLHATPANEVELHAMRRRGVYYTADKLAELPDYVKQYMMFVDDGTLDINVDDAREAGLEFDKWSAQTIEREIPRDPAIVRRELQAAARKHLRRAKLESG